LYHAEAWRREVGGHRSEVGGREKTEVGGQKSEIALEEKMLITTLFSV
jgi:hypothetical protein